MTTQRAIRRGDVFYADLTPTIGSEQGGVRPVVIVQNEAGNLHSPLVIAAPLTTSKSKKRLPTHVRLDDSVAGLQPRSLVLLEQLRALDKQRLLEYAGTVGVDKMREIDQALRVSVGLR